MPCTMKDYFNGGSIPQEQYFRMTLCQSRLVAEWSSGRLKARFGALKRAMNINLDELPYVTYASFALHNFCELNNEKIEVGKISEATEYDMDFQSAVSSNNYATDCNEIEGKRVRRVLTKYFDP